MIDHFKEGDQFEEGKLHFCIDSISPFDEAESELFLLDHEKSFITDSKVLHDREKLKKLKKIRLKWLNMTRTKLETLRKGMNASKTIPGAQLVVNYEESEFGAVAIIKLQRRLKFSQPIPFMNCEFWEIDIPPALKNELKLSAIPYREEELNHIIWKENQEIIIELNHKEDTTTKFPYEPIAELIPSIEVKRKCRFCQKEFSLSLENAEEFIDLMRVEIPDNLHIL